ncbi:AraC family transcriptional regulator [Maricaulis virginensis]|uniref:AraC family transcriptional regulator n=1 Tax=Maricaulis virginensis TaxID=144022 RepID=A0A9W6MPN0_9PROT|nr:AraC family transcriptional regulator [Maricaulis virginensis]GLK53383.1 AraC family transcriptional regulator [Maricaulis virginensis]
MRADNRAGYADRIDRVVAHIEAADEEALLDLDTLAGVAALSPFHFHRIYRIMTGETPAETVRRIRLVRTAPALQDDRLTVTQAAAASGYATSQSFARAIKAATGATASEIRAGGGSLLERLLQPQGADAATPMRVEIVSTDPLRLLAIRNIGAYAELNRTYERLFATVFSQLPMESLRGIWGVWHEDPRFCDPADLHFDCAIEIGEDFPAQGEVELLDIAGGRHARLRHVGSYTTLHDTIDRLYAFVMADDTHLIADRPLIVNYVDDPESRPEAEWRSDIYLPLA